MRFSHVVSEAIRLISFCFGKHTRKKNDVISKSTTRGCLQLVRQPRFYSSITASHRVLSGRFESLIHAGDFYIYAVDVVKREDHA